MKHFSACVLTALVVTMGHNANAGGITYYSSKTEWIAQTNGYQTETFVGQILHDPYLLRTSFNDEGFYGTDGVAFYAYLATPENNTSSPAGDDYTTWTFRKPITYFGADFNLENPGGPGTGLQIVLDWNLGTETKLDELLRTTGDFNDYKNPEFWGFISDIAFTTLTVMAGTQDLQPASPGGLYSVQEFYSMTNMVYGTNPVPEPATMVLLGVGIAGLAGIRRRKK